MFIRIDNPGFNGATSSRTWKGEEAVTATIQYQKLQWSHVLTNVESTSRCARATAASALQWSHVLTNVERLCGHRPLALFRCFNGATSSRTWKELKAYTDGELARASMEPRPHERGKTLQNRRLCIADISFNGATSSRTWKGKTERKGRGRKQGSFNGATSSRTWKGRLLKRAAQSL